MVLSQVLQVDIGTANLVLFMTLCPLLWRLHIMGFGSCVPPPSSEEGLSILDIYCFHPLTLRRETGLVTGIINVPFQEG